MIPFNRAPFVGQELENIKKVIADRRLSGNGYYTQQCEQWFEQELNCSGSLLTPSCTHALEMIAILIDIKPGDEVIMPSFTFVSTANAFAIRGAVIRFVDICPDTMNIDPKQIEQAVTAKTKAIVAVHYASVACEMDAILAIAKRHELFVIEDAAQAICSHYQGKPLGSLGDFGAFSFHETKNITSGGEGGLLVINRPEFVDRAEIIREKGTNRKQFIDGKVDKYTWVDIGSSFLASELQAAYLFGQLGSARAICEDRRQTWFRYYDALICLSDHIELPQALYSLPHNGHIFFIKLKDIKERSELLQFLNAVEIMAAFHYVPLHSATAGQRLGTFVGDDTYTSRESERLIRLPLWYNMPEHVVERVVDKIKAFYQVD